jgi:hypothetical protein
MHWVAGCVGGYFRLFKQRAVSIRLQTSISGLSTLRMDVRTRATLTMRRYVSLCVLYWTAGALPFATGFRPLIYSRLHVSVPSQV